MQPSDLIDDEMALDLAAIKREAVGRRSKERLDRIADIRAAHRLRQAGHTQRQIAEILGVTQPRVHRMLKNIDHLVVEESHLRRSSLEALKSKIIDTTRYETIRSAINARRSPGVRDSGKEFAFDEFVAVLDLGDLFPRRSDSNLKDMSHVWRRAKRLR